MRPLVVWILALIAGLAHVPAQGADVLAPTIVSINAQLASSVPPRFQGLHRVASLGEGAVAVAGRINDHGYLVVLGSGNKVISGVQFPHIMISDVAATADSGILIAGTVNVSSLFTVSGVPFGQWPVVIRTDGRGVIVMATILVTRSPTPLIGIAEINDGAIVAVGNIARPRQHNYRSRADNRRFDPVIIKMAPTGAITWAGSIIEAIHGETGGIGARGAVVKQDGALFVAGAEILIHLSESGGLLWAQRFAPAGNFTLSTRGVTRSADAAIVGGIASRPGRAGLDAWAMSIQEDGTLRWAKFFDAGPSDRIEAVGGSAGTALFAGISRRMGATLEDKVHREDGWLLELDDSGHVVRSLSTGGDGDDHLSAAALVSDGRASVGTVVVEGNRQNVLLRMKRAPRGSPSSLCQFARPVAAMVEPAPITLSPARLRIESHDVENRPFQPQALPLAVTVNVLCGQ